VFERILKQLRERIRTGRFVVTLHAIEELDDEGLSVLDVEHAISPGRLPSVRKTLIRENGNIS
jgi:hypothetical protein